MKKRLLSPLLCVTDEGRRVYEFQVVINKRRITEIHIDPHYEKEHGSYMNDGIIYRLAQQLDQREFEIEDKKGDFEYFVVKRVFLGKKNYKLVCCLEVGQNYLGIIDAYRYGKYDKE
jgi:hypothetical protein